MVAGAGITDVVFDFCGVLIDRQVARALEGHYSEDEISEYFAYDDRSGFHYFDDLLDRGVSPDEAVARCERERGADAAKMLRCYVDHIDRCYGRLVPGAAELVADLAARGVRLWALTNMSRPALATVLKRFPQVTGALSGALASAEAGAAKPDERLFGLAIERFGIDPARTLFVDDNSINVAAAMRTGMRGTTFITVGRLRNTLRELGLNVDTEDAENLQEEERTMYENHDGASACTTSHALAQDAAFTPDNGGARGVWRAVRLGSIGVPAPGEDFWAERCREYRALQWNQMDWGFVRGELERIAGELGSVSCREPEIVIRGAGERERTFLEQWFGYGDAQCAVRLKGGRLQVTSGQHRLLAVANRPVSPEDAKLLGLDDGAFCDGGALDRSTMLPFFVHEAA